jgi:hypothetical protein
MQIEPENFGELNIRWERLLHVLKAQFRQELKMEAILLLIGIQELGLPPKPYTKQEKTDLMHIGLCRILEPAGYYRFIGRDPDGWPHWELTQPIPHQDLLTQVNLMRKYIVTYFEGVFEELMQP